MIDRLDAWTDTHRSVALDLIRIYLGVGLFARGLVFLSEPGSYAALLPGGEESVYASAMLMHYVALAHIGGGLLLAGGLLTRVAALVQIPVLLGAVFVIHWPDTLLTADQSFAFSALVLALLSVSAVWGGGPWSLDRAVALWNARTEADEEALIEENARLVRERPRLRRPAPEREAVTSAPCTCDEADVVVERTYSRLGRLRFVTGTHPRPTAVVLRCKTCGGVVKRIEDPASLEAYRYLPEVGI
ncbi:MAG: DoxX family protein [Bacteroidota bacterium]